MTRWAQEGWQGTAHVQPGGRNPRSQLLAGLALFQCILSQRLDARALGEKMGYLVVLGEVWAVQEAPGKKEGFLEWEVRGDLGNLEDTLKKFFLAES